MRTRIALTLIATQCSLPFTAAVSQEIGQLYAPRPPAGSAYVRVVNPGLEPVKIQLATGRQVDTLSSKGLIATDYRIVQGGRPLTISIDGRALGDDLRIPAGSFVTLILESRNQGYGVKPIKDLTDTMDGLRAELRFYNLSRGCTATLSVIDGPLIFEQVKTDDTRRRTINPVEVSLVGRCGQAVSAPQKLPALKTGDRYSLFLVGAADTPALVGQRDRTEAYRGPVRE